MRKVAVNRAIIGCDNDRGNAIAENQKNGPTKYITMWFYIACISNVRLFYMVCIQTARMLNLW